MLELAGPADLAAALHTLCTDTTRLYRLQGPAVGGLLVERFIGHEALNQPYEWRVQVLSTQADLPLEPWLDTRVDLLTIGADGRPSRVSGLVAQARALASDGGFARYELLVVPWLWRLRLGGRQRAWQHQSIRRILDGVFAPYQPRAAWRWAPGVDEHLEALGHPDYLTQGRENDLDFVQRLLARAGLGLRFEEVDGDDDAAGLGHRAVLFAHSTEETACPQHPDSERFGAIRYHRAHSQERRDTVQTCTVQARHGASRTTTLAWHASAKRALAAQVPSPQGEAGAAPAEDYDPAVAADTPDTACAAARTRLLREAAEGLALRHCGRATVRGTRAGQWWRLTELPTGELDLLLTELTHLGVNNLPKDLQAAAERLLDDFPGSEHRVDPAVLAQARSSGYAHQWQGQPRSHPWRPVRDDGTGARWAPKPTAAGPQSALVVGPDGQPQAQGAQAVYTDRLGRIRIRFHWQARHDAHDERDASSDHTVWVRVAQRWAGAGMGQHFIPRIGQEVLVDFIERDLDRPLVVGVLYNGRGQGGVPATPGGRAPKATEDEVFSTSTDHTASAQANLTGGHSPAWHGAAPGPQAQANAAALSGLKSREFGGLGANQLVFDDTPGQLRAHAATTQHASWLSLGHLIHQADNHRGSLRGLGLELRTDAYGAVRGGRGVLLSTYAQAPHEPAGDPTPGLALLQQAKALAQSFDRAAQTHQTVPLASHQGSTQANASLLNPHEPPLQALHESVKGTVSPRWPQAQDDAAARHTGTAQGELPHSSDPVLQAQAKAGLAWVAGQDVIVSADEVVHLAAGQDQHGATGGAYRLHTGQAIGVLAGAIEPGQDAAGTGLTMIAAQGDVQLQAQSDRLEIAAKEAVDIQSAHAHIDWAAARKITLATAGGARITLQASGLTVECPGTIRVQAGSKRMVGAERVEQPLPLMPRQVCVECLLSAQAAGAPFATR
jgi:type VI secretion system secreted protein VgrG